MKVLIIEDEPVNARELAELIQSMEISVSSLSTADTIDSSVDQIRGSAPDLIFMDIELGDGSAFEIFDQVEVNCPIIFTTAYDEFALKAFEQNSIAYLLKPITSEKLNDAFDKLKRLQLSNLKSTDYRSLFQPKDQHKSNFLVKFGNSLIPIEVNQILYFFSDENQVYLVADDQKKYLTSYSLTYLEEILDPNVFFRLNRQYIAHRQSIQALKPYDKGQVSIELRYLSGEDPIASRQKTAQLKDWLQ